MRNTWELPEGRLEEIERVTAAATEGPWVAEPVFRRYGWKVWQYATMPPRDLAELALEADAAFIAASRTFVPELIAAYRAAVERIKALEAERG